VEYDTSLRLTDQEITQAFSDPDVAAKLPPVLSLEEAAELMRLKLGGIRDWRSRRLLSTCSVRAGREVKVFRDRFIKAVFNDLIATYKGMDE
jgi:hypothetical protein